MVKVKILLNGNYEEYIVPNNIKTVLDALNYINKQYNRNIKFRSSCRAGQCGSCGMMINGEPRLACKTKLTEDVVIEPLKNFNVIEDLIIDRSQYYKKLDSIRNYIHTSNNIENDFKISKKDMNDFKKVRNCIECLNCLATCPSRENYNYPGPTIIRQLARFSFDPRDEKSREEEAFFENIYSCTTCGKCMEVCPNEIDIVHKGIEKLRSKVFSKNYYLKNHLLVRDNLIKYNRSVEPQEDALLSQLKDEYIVKDEKMRVAFFTGCLIDYRLQKVGLETIRVLNAHGVSVIVPKEQICCGSPMIRTGQLDIAKKLMKHNLKVLNAFGKRDIPIITVCAGCGSTLKRDYNNKDFEVLDITEVLCKVGPIEYKPYSKKITYHDPCHLNRGQGICKEPRKILKNIPKLEFVEMENSTQCCGAGGGVRSGIPTLSKSIGMRKANMVIKTNCDNVITICPFCEYHIRDCLNEYCKNNKIDKKVEVMNIVSLLNKVI